MWSAVARRDLTELDHYYGAIDAGIADIMLARIEQAPMLLTAFPALGSPTSVEGARKWRVRVTPYILIYRAAADRLTIVRVLHSARDELW